MQFVSEWRERGVQLAWAELALSRLHDSEKMAVYDDTESVTTRAAEPVRIFDKGVV
jgi:hypothetical protein